MCKVYLGIEFHIKGGIPPDHLLVIPSGLLQLPVHLVDLAEDKQTAGLDRFGRTDLKGTVQEIGCIGIFLLGNAELGIYKVCHQLVLIRCLALPDLVHHHIQHRFGTVEIPQLNIGESLPEHGFVFNVVLIVGLYDKLESPAGHRVIHFIEIGFPDQHVGIVDPFHVFLSAEGHGVLLDRFGGFLDAGLGKLPHFPHRGLISVIIDRENQGVIVLGVRIEFLNRLAQVIHTVPVNIVMSGKVMVHPAGQGVLFGGTG